MRSNWTWLDGGPGPGSCQAPVYGTRGVESPDNCIGVRTFHSMDIDSQRQLIYVFGGGSFDSKYTPVKNLCITHRYLCVL